MFSTSFYRCARRMHNHAAYRERQARDMYVGAIPGIVITLSEILTLSDSQKMPLLAQTQLPQYRQPVNLDMFLKGDGD